MARLRGGWQELERSPDDNMRRHPNNLERDLGRMIDRECELKARAQRSNTHRLLRIG